MELVYLTTALQDPQDQTKQQDKAAVCVLQYVQVSFSFFFFFDRAKFTHAQ